MVFRLYLVVLQNFQNFLGTVLSMDIQIDGLGKIKTEDTHDRLGVDYISS